jgi:hypothetical protein
MKEKVTFTARLEFRLFFEDIVVDIQAPKNKLRGRTKVDYIWTCLDQVWTRLVARVSRDRVAFPKNPLWSLDAIISISYPFTPHV